MSEGEEPDYRFSLANERTFLAWIRTALALLAAAVAVIQLVPPFRIDWGRTVLGALLSLAAVLASIGSYHRWAANERAMRRQRALPFNRMLGFLALVLSVVSVLVGSLILSSRG